MTTSSKLRIAVIAGELSGDRYGAALVTELRGIRAVEIVALGGPALNATADHYVGDSTANTAVGLRSVRGMKSTFKLFDSIVNYLKQWPVDQAIIIDFPHYNFEIARRLRALNIPITTLITPNFWIWNDLKSARKIANYSQQIFAIFPPEYQMYCQINANVKYFGNPIVDLVPPVHYRQLGPYPGDGTDQPITIGLFPGSRRAELNLLLRPLLQIAHALHQRSTRFRFVLPVARPELFPLVAAAVRRRPVSELTVTDSLDRDAVAQLDFAIAATGTLTLELIMNRIPMVILGALPTLSYWVAQYILQLKVPYCGLPNLIAGEKKIPEFMQQHIVPADVADCVFEQMTPDKQAQQQAHYTQLIEMLKPNDESRVLTKMATAILEASPGSNR